MKFLAHVLSISSFALLGLAAPVAEPKALNGVAGASGTIGDVANAVSTPISLPSDINTVPDTVITAVHGIRKPNTSSRSIHI